MNRYFIFYLLYPILMGVIMFEYRRELLHLFKVKVLHVETKADVLVGVISHRSHFDKRQTIRETWWKNFSQSDHVALRFVVGKHVCLIHPEDLLDEYGCDHWHVSVPESTSDLALVSSISEDKTDEYTYNFGVQRIQFKVLHEIVITHLGVHKSCVENDAKVYLSDAKHEGFEGTLLGKRLDSGTDELSAPTSRVLTQINDGGGVLYIQQYEPHVDGHYSNVKEWNRPHVPLVSFKFNIHDEEKLRRHINETSIREEQWRKKVEKEFEKLVDEQYQYGDLLLVDAIDVYRNIPNKVLQFIKWATEDLNFKFLMKTDDDAYVNLESILHYSKLWTNITNLWWGRFRHNWAVEHAGKWAEQHYKAPVYPKFACGSGYVVGQDVANWIANNADDLHIYQGEDVSMGIWLSAIMPTYMDDPLWQCDAECISDMHATADMTTEEIRTLHHNLETCGDPCGCDS